MKETQRMDDSNDEWSAERVDHSLRLEGVPPPRLEPEYVILLVKFVFKRIYAWWWFTDSYPR